MNTVVILVLVFFVARQQVLLAQVREDLRRHLRMSNRGGNNNRSRRIPPLEREIGRIERGLRDN